MPTLLAIDVALLPPPDVTQRAIESSASLPAEGSEGLRLDPLHLPHVTLVQLYVRENELDAAFERIDEVLGEQHPLRLLVSGGGRSRHTLWMTIERTPDLVALHERLMEALRGLERQDGGPAAFFEGEGRVGDVLWVAGYRLKSSLEKYTPHITLGHGAHPPAIEPFAFDASTVAACHLGRFCTCRRVLRGWTLTPPAR
jgi:2'-5' RNA ligase